MTAVMSSGTSPVSVPLDEDGMSWHLVESVSADAGSFIGSSGSFEHMFPMNSPSIASLESWNNVVGPSEQQSRLLQTPSPIMLNANEPSVSLHARAGTFTETVSPAGMSPSAGISPGDIPASFDLSSVIVNPPPRNPQPQEFVSQGLQKGQAFADCHMVIDGQNEVASDFNTGYGVWPILSNTGLDMLQTQSSIQFDIPYFMQIQHHANGSPWNGAKITRQDEAFVPEHFTPPSRSSIELSPKPSPGSIQFRQESRPNKAKDMYNTNRSERDRAGIRKPQKRSSTRTLSSSSPDRQLAKNPVYQFCNATLDTWGKSEHWDEDIQKSSQKGRKGALSEDTRENALKVRKRGACFCCRVRKVKCDEARPCKNCQKLCGQVPQAVCWQFSDFAPVLFPDFVRTHFKKDEMSRFVEINVQSFTLDGVETPCIVTLSSGQSFMAKLVVKAKFFTARTMTSDVMQHWFHFIGERGVELEAVRAAPIGLEMDAANSSQRSELRRKVEAYVDAITKDPSYSLQLTDSMRKTNLPRKVLQIVQRYAQQSGSQIVKRALSIYAMHYIMTRHLTMTPQSIASLQLINPVAQNGPYMTPRLLNRQIKALIDDVMQAEVSGLFDDFTKHLKQKSRKEWAPCMAAFLVLCLLMEAIEASADVFAISENEIDMRKGRAATFKRAFALDINSRIENMPFKQFAFQFHQIYLTHSRDASAKSFNPLVENNLNEMGDLDPAALELVLSLRNILQTDWDELDWLTVESVLPNREDHPYPRNVEEDYVGRLLAKFLLSFMDSWYIFGAE